MAFMSIPGNATQFYATSAGLGDFVVASAVAGYYTPLNSAVSDGNGYLYYAQSADGLQWEAGDGTFNVAGDYLSRDTIIASSNSDNSKVNFTTIPIVSMFAGGTPPGAPGPGPGLEGPFPRGTIMVFGNATAPLGWTRVTTHDDCALRIVGTATPGSGGSNGFSTVFAQTTVGNHTLTITEIPSHPHTIEGNDGSGAGPVTGFGEPSMTLTGISAGSINTDNAGGGGAHNHPIIMQIKYVDFILAMKN